MDRGAWRATVHGVVQTWIPLSTSALSETWQLLSSEPCAPAAFRVDEVQVGVGRGVDATMDCAPPPTPTPTSALTCAALLRGAAGSVAKRI